LNCWASGWRTSQALWQTICRVLRPHQNSDF
jgi:hypothetical protein